MLRTLLLAMAVLMAIAGTARAELRLFTLTNGPVQTAQAEQNAPQIAQTIMGYDVMTFTTVAIGAMFGAAVGTELAVIGLGVYGYPAATLWLAGTTAFVSGALGGGATANWLLEASRAPRTSPLDRAAQGPAQANARR